MASKEDLLSFLDKRVFHPILHAKHEKYAGKQREVLRDVQKRTEDEKARFHGYGSAEQIVAMYRDDIHSDAAKIVNADLENLGLPRLVDVREEFLKLAGEAG